MALAQTFSRLRLVTADTLPLRPPTAAIQKLALAPGQLHEFSSPTGTPPLTVMLGLAGKSLPPHQRLLFLGRACWPTFQVLYAMLNGGLAQSKLENGGGQKSKIPLSRCLFLDPLSPRERFWALAEALRCPAIGAVIADAADLDATASRRLQLAAEAGARHGTGVLALLARPPNQRAQPSWAATRWDVRPWSGNQHSPPPDQHAPGAGRVDSCTGNKTPPAYPPPPDSLSTRMSWELTLSSCRHGYGADAPRRWIFSWTYQVFRGTGAFDLSAAVGYSAPPASVAQTA